MLVTVSGPKLWRLKYRIDGKEKKLSLGSYLKVGLKEARERRDAPRKAAQAGSDPAAEKREARIARHFAAGNTFGAIAEEYICQPARKRDPFRGEIGAQKRTSLAGWVYGARQSG